METETIIIVSVFSAAWLVVFIMAAILFVRVSSLRKVVTEMQATGRIRVQKLKMETDKNHAFHNPALSPDEELSRRGYSMYMPDVDVESGRGTSERQTGGQFVEELTREIDNRQQRQSSVPLHDNMDRYSRDPEPRQESRYMDPPRQESRYMDPPRQESRYMDPPRQESRYMDPPRQESRYTDPRQSANDSRHRDFDPRQSGVDQRQSSAPPFLLQAIEENKRKSRLANPVANVSGRQSDTNPNFIY